MSEATPTPVITAGDLVMLSEEARRKYNRALSKHVLDLLDDDGINLVTFTLANDDYMRAHVLIKLKDREEPVTAWLDMSYERFNSLARVAKRDGEWARVEA